MAPSTTSAIAIEQVDNTFRLTRLPDGESAAPVSIASPYEWPVEGKPASNLMAELRWYLEDFLKYPFYPQTLNAEHVLDALKAWGRQAFNALFDRRSADVWLANSSIVQIRSNDPGILSWPWEALYDPQSSFLAHDRRVERRMNQLAPRTPLAALPTERVNILLVVARPYGQRDVGYRSLARALVEMKLPAHIDVLRPPTFDQLRDHLRAHPGYYHVLHFDGHGAYGESSGELARHTLQGEQGCLIFENPNGGPDPKSANDLSTLLKAYAVPAVVLNACQSAMLDQSAEDAFSSVATALLKHGMRSVVAMAYSLYVSGAQQFLPAFYRRLFEAGSVAEGVRAGRQQMLANKGRVCARGRFPLEDWLLPVLYQQDPLDFTFASQARPERRESRLPEEIRKQRDEYGFIGRDSAILAMERALHRNTPAILVQGLGGVGKTTLARGFLRWLDETGGLDGALWLDFRNIRSAEYVIDRTGELFHGENFRLAKDKLELLAEAMDEKRVLIVWDNFESMTEHAGLAAFLDAIRGRRGKVIITSRSPEEWLGPTRAFPLKLGGLDGEERWEYCETILRELGLQVKRDDPELSGLMDQLAGHPLAMRVVLPKLAGGMSAAQIAKALKTNIAELGLSTEEATIRLVEQGFPEELRTLLPLVGLHEGYVTAGFLEHMAKQSRPQIDRLMEAVGVAGLVRDVGSATYEMHPLLTSYLRSRGETPEAYQRGFVDVMGRLADQLAPRELHEQRVPFLLHGANFHFALGLAERLGMDQHVAALVKSLAAYAQNCRGFVEAGRLFARLAEHCRSTGDLEGEAGAHHQLGRIAEEQRDFAEARDWYLKSLAISEKQGNLRYAANSYHQLGRIAEEQRDFAAAREWYIKSLAIKEQQGDRFGVANTYHQLGRIAEKKRDFVGARTWFLKSLAIEEQQGNLHGAAKTYGNLGNLAQAQGKYEEAREWQLKSLAIFEKQGDLHAASNYHNLATIAGEQGDFAGAREWFLKSLAIKEQLGDLHAAASTYGNLGNLAGMQGIFEESGRWLVRAITGFLQSRNEHSAAQIVRNFLIFHQRASSEDKRKLEAIWREANLGDFPSTPP